MNIGILAVSFAVLLSLSWTPVLYAQPSPTETSTCTQESTQHWDKIIFEIKNKKIAEQVQQPKDTELDIKVRDDPNEVADLKKKILDFLGLPINSENRKGIKILNVEFSILCTEKKIVLSPDADNDGDGLINKWEESGIDQNNDNNIDLILPGANPLHKDIYVEVDYMTFHKPWIQAVSDVKDSFEHAPVTNPDGYNGINLHAEVDEQISHQPTTSMANLVSIRDSNFGTVAQRADPNSANIIDAKLMAYHYALFGHSQPGTSSSGRSNGIPAMEFLVSLGASGWGTDPMTGHTVGSTDQQEGTFMHELGHNLNLHHGGSDDMNCKPNYLSVMSYTRQFSSLIGDRPLDYSRSALPSLNEANLDENIGIGTSNPLGLRTIYGPAPVVITTAGNPEDWNRDGDTIDTGLSDINLLDSCNPSPNQVLNGFDDWNNLAYITSPAAGASPGASSGVAGSNSSNSSLLSEGLVNSTISSNESKVVSEPDLTVENIRQHRVDLLEGINNTINSLPNNAFIQPGIAEGIKEGLTIKPQSQMDKISNLLESDKLDPAIAELTTLKNLTDSSAGGLAADDLITDPQAQQEVIPLIDNLIQVLEKQK
jgi:hypothetical protein